MGEGRCKACRGSGSAPRAVLLLRRQEGHHEELLRRESPREAGRTAGRAISTVPRAVHRGRSARAVHEEGEGARQPLEALAAGTRAGARTRPREAPPDSGRRRRQLPSGPRPPQPIWEGSRGDAGQVPPDQRVHQAHGGDAFARRSCRACPGDRGLRLREGIPHLRRLPLSQPSPGGPRAGDRGGCQRGDRRGLCEAPRFPGLGGPRVLCVEDRGFLPEGRARPGLESPCLRHGDR